MSKLGIDLGSSSLGWSINEEGQIVKKGVITFDTGMKKGQSGGYTSPTRERREARSKRNLIRARKYRKWALLNVLLEEFVPINKFELETWSKYKKGRINKFPENEKFLKWLACDFTYEGGIKYNNPYELRVKALDIQLTKHEFGRALYHIVQRRGYKDIGETDKETEKQIERRGESGFQKALDEHKTIAKALLYEFLNNDKRARNQYPYRDEYREELELICKGQGYNTAKNESNNYIDSFITKLWKAIIWQRPLRTQKGNIGKCSLEPNKLRCSISHPVYEIFRTWQFINTIKYFDENNEKLSLNQEHKVLLFEWFLKKDKNFKFEEIKTFLNKKYGKPQKYNFPIDKDGKYDTSVSGMPVCKDLINIFGENVKQSICNIEQYNVDNIAQNGGFGNAPKIIEQYSIYDLWHAVFDFDEQFLEKFATEKLNISNVTRKRKGIDVSISPLVELKQKFTQGYASLSIKAMCKIIPFLKEGYLYNEAVVLAKMPEIFGNDWEIKKEKIYNIVNESNKTYEWNKTVIGITNNLIDKYKGLDESDKFAYKDFKYSLQVSDFKDIENACENYFGKLSWSKRTNKNEIITTIKENYQAFFNDTKRAYRSVEPLNSILNRQLKANEIILNGKLYHHSDHENIYNKSLIINRITGEQYLPKDKKTNIEILPNPQIDSIKNPMFNKSMSILRRLINKLIVKGDIDSDTEVIVELARELNDNNKRIAIERYQNERRNNREKYRAFLQEFKKKENNDLNIEDSIPTLELWTEQIFEETEDENKQKVINQNRSEILKEKDTVKRYELWLEQKGQCMYTGKMISIAKLFSNEIDIEHTIPKWILPDNTLANQTVCFARYNRDIKKKQFPFFCENFSIDTPNGTRILPRLNDWKKTRDNYKSQYEDRLKPHGNEDENTKNKRIQEKHYYKFHYDYWNDKIERFEAKEVKNSWVRRQLTDTQMVSKYAKEFLKLYFKKVAIQKGSVTADFRKIYSFQAEEEIKNRNKHTHHAIDAAVLTFIPVNSSKRDELIKKANEYEEKYKKQLTIKPHHDFDAQRIINEIEKTTLIVNYEKDKILQKTKKKIRKRGRIQFLQDKNGKHILDTLGNRIPLKTKGDTIRSTLYAQTYLGKIKDVERYEDGQPKRKNGDWKYKEGKDAFCFVKNEDINKVKVSDKLIAAIVDPIIRKIVETNKAKDLIYDSQGKIIRHVRIKTNAGKEVKERLNYRSKHDYKNKFYSEAGSVPYAIILQKRNLNNKLTYEGKISTGEIEREMIPIASFEIAKLNKKLGKFDIEKYIEDFYPTYKDWNKKILKIGQKVFVIKDDTEFEKREAKDFQRNRLYVITQFSEGSIWLKYHLNAQSKDEVKKDIIDIKDKLLRKYEIELNIPEVKEDTSIVDNKNRKEDYENRKYRFDTINNSFRLKKILEIVGKEKINEIKQELDKYKAIPSTIEIEGNTQLLKMSKENWNFLYEGIDFVIDFDGSLKFIEK